MKKRVIVISLCGLVMFNGCSFSSFTGGKKDMGPVIPENALVVSENNSIDIGPGKIKIPEGYVLGETSVIDGYTKNEYSFAGIWEKKEEEQEKTTDDELNIDELDMDKLDDKSLSEENSEVPTVEYKEAVDPDVLFYAISGEDKSSPDKELAMDQVRSCMNVYVGYFRDLLTLNYPMLDDITKNDKTGKPEVDESGYTSTRISKDRKWYYTTFTCTSGDAKTTTYNTMCYPKTYFGVVMLSVDLQNDSSREFHLLAFSNDSEGKIMSEADYDSFFGKIKTDYNLSGFYTAPEMVEEANSSTNLYDGRTYAQFNDLMQDTYNYYSLKNSNVDEESEQGLTFDFGGN